MPDHLDATHDFNASLRGQSGNGDSTRNRHGYDHQHRSDDDRGILRDHHGNRPHDDLFGAAPAADGVSRHRAIHHQRDQRDCADQRAGGQRSGGNRDRDSKQRLPDSQWRHHAILQYDHAAGDHRPTLLVHVSKHPVQTGD